MKFAFETRVLNICKTLNMNKLDIELLREVEAETKRFLKKLDMAKKRIQEDQYAVHGCKETGAIKRSALDLKNELTRITQSTAYY